MFRESKAPLRASAFLSLVSVLVVGHMQVATAGDKPAGPPSVSVLPFPDPVFKGKIGRTTAELEARFSAADPAARWRAQHLAHPHRRRRLWRLECVRRPDSDPDARSARCEGDQIQRVQHHRALLAHARGALDRARSAQSPSRHHHGAKPRLSGLRFVDAEEHGHDRRNPARQWLQHGVVRQES